jgi:hypothetical protein
MPEMIACDFCLKVHPESVVLVESALRKAHICEICVADAVKLIEEKRRINNLKTQ